MPLIGLEPETFQHERRPYAPRRPRLGWPFWLLLALFIGVMCIGVNEVWLFGHPGWNGSRRSVAGINYVRYGFLETKFAPVENLGPAPKERWQVYWHHPVLIHALTGASFRVFGVHEWAARLVPILLSTLSFLLLYVLTLRWWGRRGAVATALSFTALPLLGFYGKMVNHEPLVLALSLSLAWLLVRFHEARRWRHVALAGALALLGSFSDWPWFLVLFVTGAFELGRIFVRRRRERDVRFLVVLSLAAIVGLVAVTYYLTQFSGEIGGFKKLFGDRSGGGGETYGFKSLWNRRDWYWELFAPVSTAAGVAWLLAFVPRALRRRLGPADALIGGSFVVGLVWLRLFAQAADIHEYWAFYLVPFLALSTAWLLLAVADGVAAIAERLAGRGRAVGAALLAVGLAATVFVGARGLLARQKTPSDVGREQPEFRVRNAIVGEWLGAKLRPGERVLVQDGIPVPFQLGYYLRADTSTIRIDDHFRVTRIRPGHRYLLLDRVRLPATEAVRILEELAARYPVTVLDRFCIFDLQAPDNREQSVQAFRVEFREPTALFWWFESMAYPPYDVVYSPAETFEWALHLDLERAARRKAPRLERPAVLRAADPYAEARRLSDWVAWHNAQRLLGRPTAPAIAALRHALGPPVDVRFGDEVALVWVETLPEWGDRLVALPFVVGRVDGEATPTLEMRMDRRVALPVERWRRQRYLGAVERVWHAVDPRPDAWRRGMFVVDAFPFPDEPYPQELVAFFDRARKKTREDLAARPGNRTTPVVGKFDFDAERSFTPESPFDWTATAGPACAPTPVAGSAVARLPRRCVGTLRPLLDVSTPLTLSGADTLRFEGLRYLGQSGGRARYHLVLSAVDDIDHDWDVRIAIARPKKGTQPPGYFAPPDGRVATAGWKAGETFLVPFAAIGDKGPVSVWVRMQREESSGGRLPVVGVPSGGSRGTAGGVSGGTTALFPARADPRYAAGAE